jgi:hypothetical protein
MTLHVRIECPPVPGAIEALAEGLTRLNVALIEHAAERGVEAPYLYDTNVRYRREPRGNEWWQTADDILGIISKGSGDCEDLSAYHSAWLRVFEGEMARVKIIRTPRGSFHAVVEREDGTIDDPSRVLVEKEIEQKERQRRR